MSALHLSYSYDHPQCEGRIDVINSFFNKDSLLITTVETGNRDGETDAYISRDDAIDLAWSILEHYKVTERPSPPLAAGDLVAFENGHDGRITKIDVNEPALLVHRPAGGSSWRYSTDATRITEEEFLERAKARAAKFLSDN